MEHKVTTLLGLAWTEKWTLLCSSVLLLISSMITMALPVGLGQIVDLIFNTDNEGSVKTQKNLTNICMAILAVGLIQAVCTFGRCYLMEIASDRITNNMRTEVFGAILRQEIGFFDENNTGDLINRLSNDTAQLSYCVTGNISNGLKSFFQAIVGITIMTYQSMALTRISLTIVPGFALISIKFGDYLKKIRKELHDELAIATQIAQERISNIRTVRAFCQEALEVKTYEDRLRNVTNLGRKEGWVNSIFTGLVILPEDSIVSVLYFGGQMITEKSIAMGTLTSFILHVVYVGNSLHGLSSFYIQWMKGQGSSVRLWELLGRKPSIPLTGGYIPFKMTTGKLEFHNVSFFYPRRPDTVVIDDVTLEIPAGSMFAIVGPSGTGKSTLVSLILRFYDPTSGSIKLDGIDISCFDPKWLRQRIGTVSQEPVLFSGSIKDNILYGTPNPEKINERKLLQITEEAGAWEFIQKLSGKFETVVGERGVMLSGGQRQRIAIARALIKDPKILIFDEATSSLDAENEHLVQEALERVAENRTVIIIAHRLSTIRNANKIVVVSDGKFAEVGTYEDLMNIPYGKFRKLVERQTIDNSKITNEINKANNDVESKTDF